MAELYSITGLFVEDFPGISPWGGHFIRGIDKNSIAIEGLLSDIWGMSRIAGIMDKDRLKFRKEYDATNRNQSFNYDFVLKEGIWQGRYTSTQTDYHGDSVCKTALCLNKLDFRNVDLRTPEGFSKAIVESMVQTGKLEQFTDPDTSEIMVKPK